MPFYHCLGPTGLFTQAIKQEIADEITRIHCEATGALSYFIQVQFEEVDPSNVFQNRKPSTAVRLHARIRAGRSAEQRHEMLKSYTAMLHRITNVLVVNIMVAFIETSFENVMESGARLPAPGEEAAWAAQFAHLLDA
ncbi:tautomerase family protein [Bradyrhizobium sp. Ai1a-2]|uniref:tautomerase family protein n=1 Tax=Bradyrhizobium sp. Ai1a-2 TaxID=196490 RepID=UPI00041C1A6A|nr:tautomerase family protein [Bradyrhizobium sp. Ai1a-2]